MTTKSDAHTRSEIRDGMRITWHQPIRDLAKLVHRLTYELIRS